MKNNNGFADMASHFGELTKVDPEKISEESLKEAADYYLQALIPNIPKSLFKKKHVRDSVKVEVSKEGFNIVFEGTAFYWRFLNNGTVKRRALFFKEKTWEQNKHQIEEIMTRKLLKELEG